MRVYLLGTAEQLLILFCQAYFGVFQVVSLLRYCLPHTNTSSLPTHRNFTALCCDLTAHFCRPLCSATDEALTHAKQPNLEFDRQPLQLLFELLVASEQRHDFFGIHQLHQL